MDATHFHLAFTHFPIIGTIIGVGILAYGQFSKNELIKKVAFIIFIVMAIIAIPVFLTGEEAEEVVENLPGVSESIIGEHEELAEIAIWLMGALGIFSIISFLASAKKMAFANAISLITLIISLVTLGLFVQVGNLGGQIRHTEIRANNTIQQGGNENGNQSQNDDDDDDD